jgi:hypothetical protein
VAPPPYQRQHRARWRAARGGRRRRGHDSTTGPWLPFSSSSGGGRAPSPPIRLARRWAPRRTYSSTAARLQRSNSLARARAPGDGAKERACRMLEVNVHGGVLPPGGGCPPAEGAVRGIRPSRRSRRRAGVRRPCSFRAWARERCGGVRGARACSLEGAPVSLEYEGNWRDGEMASLLPSPLQRRKR